jgi:hypothetical protein
VEQIVAGVQSADKSGQISIKTTVDVATDVSLLINNAWVIVTVTDL